MVDVVKLLDFMKSYFYTSSEDESLFRSYLEYLRYDNGVVLMDLSKPPSKFPELYYSRTVYDGRFVGDVNINISYSDGVLDGDDTVLLDNGGGQLWVADGI